MRISDWSSDVCSSDLGVITLEFPHLLRLIDDNQFDTVYHEHFSYLSLYTVSQIFKRAGLRVWDVERLPTHGGSLRSEEHTSELQSLMRISYAVFCLKKKTNKKTNL